MIDRRAFFGVAACLAGAAFVRFRPPFRPGDTVVMFDRDKTSRVIACERTEGWHGGWCVHLDQDGHRWRACAPYLRKVA
jgi:hypothetical protein